MKQFITLLFIFIVSVSSAQVSKYLRKGTKALEKNKLEKSKANYLKAYNLDKTSYDANLYLGYLLSQFMNKHEEALPYPYEGNGGDCENRAPYSESACPTKSTDEEPVFYPTPETWR